MPDQSSIKVNIIDADNMVYEAAFAAEPTKYKWIKRVDGKIVEETEKFDSAKDAQQAFQTICMWEDEENLDKWARVASKEVATETKALELAKHVVSRWKRIPEELLGRKLQHVGYLTRSGTKSKERDDLERKYQEGRDKIERPFHYEFVKSYIESLDWIKYHKQGYEADSAIITKAEKLGEQGLISSIDKDMRQAENTWFLNMHRNYRDKIEWLDSLGEVGEVKDKGSGFKFVCYQTAAGDCADGYLGLPMFGHAAAKKVLDSCASKSECLEALLKLYEEVYGKEHTYSTWKGDVVTKSFSEMLDMHFNLAWQERKPNQWIVVEELCKNLKSKGL